MADPKDMPKDPNGYSDADTKAFADAVNSRMMQYGQPSQDPNALDPSQPPQHFLGQILNKVTGFEKPQDPDAITPTDSPIDIAAAGAGEALAAPVSRAVMGGIDAAAPVARNLLADEAGVLRVRGQTKPDLDDVARTVRGKPAQDLYDQTPMQVGFKEAPRPKQVGKLEIEHYSPANTLNGNVIDPNYMGSGFDASAKGRSSQVPYSFSYLKDTVPETEKSVGEAGFKHSATVDLSKQPVYDLSSDPEGIAARSIASNNGIMNLDDILQSARDAGYAGFQVPNHPHAPSAKSVMMFEPVQVASTVSTKPIDSNAVRQVARDYMESKGLKYTPDVKVKADPERGARIAQAFEQMKHSPNDPAVKKAYQSLVDETKEQYQLVKKMGLKLEPITADMPNPYPNGSKQVFEDISKNKHLYYYPTDQGFGSAAAITDHPLLQNTGEVLNGQELKANDMFRIVHDVFGHAKEGTGFGPNGEEAAWQTHMKMFTPEAQKALTTETRGQNSWVNFGPHGAANRANPAKTTYADQKAGLLPDWAMEEGRQYAQGGLVRSFAEGGEVPANPYGIDPSAQAMLGDLNATPPEAMPGTLERQPAAVPAVQPSSDVHEVKVFSPEGTLGSIPTHQLNEAISEGYRPASTEEVAHHEREQKYGSVGQQALTGLEGAAEAVSFGTSPALEQGLGLTTAEDQRARREINPGTHMAWQAAGLVGSAFIPGVGAANVLEHAGQGAATALGLATGEGLVNKIGSGAVKAAVENLIFQGGSETAKMLIKDPNQSVETAVTDMGLAALIGAPVGATFAAAQPLWQATLGSKVGGLLGAIKNRMGGTEGVTSDAVSNAIETLGVDVAPEVKAAMASDPAIQHMAKVIEQSDGTAAGQSYQKTLKEFHDAGNVALTEALGRSPEDLTAGKLGRSAYEAGSDVQKSLVDNLKSTIDPISEQFEGVKARFKELPLPQDSELGRGAVSEIADKVTEAAKEKGWIKSPSSSEMQLVNRVLKELPLQETLNDLRNFQSIIGNEAASKQLWNMGSTFRTIFRDAEDNIVTKALGEQAPELLEKHALARAAYKDAMTTVDSLNDALHVGKYNGPGSFIRAVQDMKPEDVLRRLSAKGDVNLMNLVKERFPAVAEQVRNYHLDTVLKGAVEGAQAGQLLSPGKLLKGIEKMSPELRDSVLPAGAKAKLEALSVLQDQLNKVPHNFSNTARTVQTTLSDLAGSAAGFATMLAGHNPVTSAIVGKLTQYLGKDVPDAARLALLKFLGSDKPIEAQGFKNMVDFFHHTMKGDTAVTKGVQNLFKAGREVLPQTQMPSAKERKKLDEHVKSLQVDASPLLNVGGKTGHYLPEHAEAMGQTAATVTSYLNSIRPSTDKKRPLDPDYGPDPIKQATYERALDIAQQPLTVLHQIKEGTLTSSDVTAMKSMYPALYSKMTNQITSEMVKSVSKDQPIPYDTRLSMSLFMGEPLDSTMTAQSIIAAQPQPTDQNQREPQQTQGSHSTKALNKLPGLYQTPGQSRQQRMAKV